MSPPANADKIRNGIVTEHAVSVNYTLDGKSVTLIDTPGFDDSKRTEVEILRLVSAHLLETYMKGTRLNGIVFLQPINQPRVGASETARTRLFKSLMGEDAYERVVIATTMWSDAMQAERRQAQRIARDDIWGDMVKRGARVVAYDDTWECATEIVRSLVKFNGPVDLLIQRELAANGGKLEDTSAGRQLDKQKGEEIMKLKNDIRTLQSEGEATAAEIRELQDKIYQREEEIQDLKRGC